MNEFIKTIDKYIENEEKEMSQMNDKFVPNNSQSLQEESLVCFMEALGYEAVFKFNGKGENLIGFRSDKLLWKSVSRISVNSAIKIHNDEPDHALDELHMSSIKDSDFKNWISDNYNLAQVAVLFAGSCKIIEQVKASGSKKNGLVVTDHNVKFMSNMTRKGYGNFIGL